MDRIDEMTAFARVVETGSFTKAAETLQISRTSATQLVQHLEARLRIKLLNRTTRKVNTTADGATYYERIVRVLADLDDTESGLSQASAQPKGRLKVDVPSPLARIILMPALPAFHARYPELQIDMGVSDRPIDLIGESVDCVVRGGELIDQSLRSRHVGELQLGLYAAPAYLARMPAPSHPAELENSAHRIVGFMGKDRKDLSGGAAAGRRDHYGTGSLRGRGRRRQRLSCSWLSRHGGAMVAAVHGQAACGPRGTAATAAGLASRSDAAACRVSAESLRQR